MERMDRARRIGGVIWVVLGVLATLGWLATTPPAGPGPVTVAMLGIVGLGTAIQLGASRLGWRWWASRVIGIFIGVELLGAVGDRFGLLGRPGEPGVSWGDWAHFQAETAQLVPFSRLVDAAAAASTGAELVLGVLLMAGLQWRWVGKATAGLFTVYLIAMLAGMGVGAVLQFGVPVLIGGALLTSARGAREPAATEP